jgi:hypothetical protein
MSDTVEYCEYRNWCRLMDRTTLLEIKKGGAQ